MYISSFVCYAEGFHGDAFGLNPDNMDKLIGFRCHLCRKRDPPICPHVLAVNSDVSQLVEAQSNAVVECNDEVSNAVPPLSEVACSSSALIPAPSCSKIFFFPGGPAYS